MHNKLLMLALGLLLTGCAEDNAQWRLQQASDNGIYQAELACATTPIIGAFQECKLRLQSQRGIPANLMIAVDGGMPAHGHGLPTEPQVISTDMEGEYRVEGLKYSMPGEWVLGFLLHSGSDQDKVIFKFSL